MVVIIEIYLMLPPQSTTVRTFPENLQQLSSILTNIWRLVATYVIKVGA